PAVEELRHVWSAACCHGGGYLLQVAAVGERFLDDSHVGVLSVELRDELVPRDDAGRELVLPVGYLGLRLREPQQHPSNDDRTQHVLHSLDVLSRSPVAPTVRSWFVPTRQ